MTPQKIKQMANSIRKCLIEGATHYYDEKYGDLKVADLLLVLEDENYHTEESIVEALALVDYNLILEACEIEVEQSKSEYLTEELSKRRQALDKKIRELGNERDNDKAR